MSYTYANFADLKTMLANRLGDPDKVFWIDAELGVYINATLREWNSIARMFRTRNTFSTNNTDLFYDLTVELPELTPVITDQQMLTQAKYMLMEPNPDDDTTFTECFTAEEFTIAFANRKRQFLLSTGLVISQPPAQNVRAGSGRVQFDDDSIIDVRRATWTDINGNITNLLREDEYTAFVFDPEWRQEAGTPQRYSILPDPLLTLQLIPPPGDSGILTLQTISSGTILDDFTPFILWGVLADVMTGPGAGNDPFRANYCAQRWQEGITIGQQVATVLQGYLNGLPVATNSVFDFDTFEPEWMVQGVPQSMALLGSNLFAVVPAADGMYAVLLDFVTNAVQLVDDADTLPIGREYLDLFIDYASHLAAFKQGGMDFQQTFDQYDAFIKAAVEYNNRMNAQNLNFNTIVDKAQQQEQQVALRAAQSNG